MNKKARDGAFTLLVAVGESMQRWSPEQDRDSVIRLVYSAGGSGGVHAALESRTGQG